MPIKKRTVYTEPPKIPTTSKYVFTDKGILIVKTPAECTKWETDFRIRIVKDYVPPKQLKNTSDFAKYFVDNDYQNEIYTISGKHVMVQQPIDELANSNHVVILCTNVISLTDKKTLFLNNDNPAMRMLMVYSFLHNKRIAGVPELHVAEWTT